MRKSLIIMLVSVFSLNIVSNCLAGTYFAGSLGFVSIEDSEVLDPDLAVAGAEGVGATFDKGMGISLAFGGSTVDGVRHEAEFSYRVNDMDTLSCSNCVQLASQ